MEETDSRSCYDYDCMLWGEAYNNQPQKLQHTNKQIIGMYIMRAERCGEQLYPAASMSRVGIYLENMIVQ